MQPVFILGNIGSGTTILHKTLLNAVDAAVDIDTSDQESRPFWMRHGIRFGTALTGTSCAAATAKSISHENRDRISAAFGRIASQGHRVITKNPHFCNKIPLLNELFPDACYLHIVREDLSVVASMKRMFIRFYKGETPWATSCIHYWPPDDRPCWSVISITKPTLKQLAREKLRRLVRHGVWVASPEFADWKEFHREHPDPTRYYPGEGFARLEEAWIRSNLNIVRDVNELKLPGRYLAINYRSLVERPEESFEQVADFLRIRCRRGFSFESVTPDRQDKWKQELAEGEVGVCHHQRKLFQAEIEELVGALPGPLLAV